MLDPRSGERTVAMGESRPKPWQLVWTARLSATIDQHAFERAENFTDLLNLLPQRRERYLGFANSAD